MFLKILKTTLAIALPFSASAGNLVTEGLDDPVVAPPTQRAFSWGGAYTGLSYGQSRHVRTYDRKWDEFIVHREETPWEEHSYSCNRGQGHYGFKCDVTGLTHAPEFGELDNVKNPWSNAADRTVRYGGDYDGLWMGADQTFAFTLPSYVDPVVRSGKWAQIEYEYLTGVDVNEWVETITHTEQATLVEDDTTFGGFVGYRHQFQKVPLVVGLEANYMTTSDHGEFAQIGAQVGFAAGRVLPYIEAGIDHYAGGVDIALGAHGQVLFGVRTWEAYDGGDSGTQVRVGWRF